MKDNTQLARWLAGELDEKELRALESSAEYPTLLRIRENFARLESPKTDGERVLRNVLSHPKIRKRKVFRLHRKSWISAAAVLVILLGLAFVFVLPKRFSTANAQTLALTLPDQSRVLLNAGSEASYNSWNWSRNREVALEGEAYFKVAKGKTFTVKTDLGTVTVLGTQFNVKARDSRFDVICYEGKVRVRFNNHEILLLPHQKVTVLDGDEALSQTPAAQPEWTHHELYFSNEKLAAVIAEIERQYNITIKTTMVSQQLFSGSLPGNDLQGALKMLSATYHMNVSESGKTITLTPDDEQ